MYKSVESLVRRLRHYLVMSGRRRAVITCCPWRYMHRRRFLVVPVAVATWTATFFQSGPRASLSPTERGSGYSPSFRPEPRAAARPLRPENRESEARRQGPEVGPWPEAKGYSPSHQGLQPDGRGLQPEEEARVRSTQGPAPRADARPRGPTVGPEIRGVARAEARTTLVLVNTTAS